MIRISRYVKFFWFLSHVKVFYWKLSRVLSFSDSWTMWRFSDKLFCFFFYLIFFLVPFFPKGLLMLRMPRGWPNCWKLIQSSICWRNCTAGQNVEVFTDFSLFSEYVPKIGKNFHILAHCAVASTDRALNQLPAVRPSSWHSKHLKRICPPSIHFSPGGHFLCQVWSKTKYE